MFEARWSLPRPRAVRALLLPIALLIGPVGPLQPLLAQEADTARVAASSAEASEPEAVVPASPDARAAAEAAESWLALLDAKDYDGAWSAASSMLQTTVSPQKLKNAVRDGRKGLDSLVSRTLVGVQEIRNPPNAAPGDYVVLLYRTRGADGWSAIETAIPRRESGGWFVSAYLVRNE